MKKKVIISLIIIFILLMIFGTGFVIFSYERDKQISLIQDDVVIEYGNSYNPKIEELINLSKYNFIDLDKVRIENNIENELEKEYPAVGKYEISIKYKNIVLKQGIEVVDTVAPDLDVEENIELEYNTDLSAIDFGKYLKITDLSKVNDFSIDLSKINSSISGEQITNVSIEDIYGNKTEKELKIKILEKTEEKIKEVAEERSISSNEQTKVNSGNKTTETSKITTSKNKTTTSNDNRTEENSNINITTETGTKESNSPNTSEQTTNQSTNKINLSKYSYYERGANGTYKGFIEDAVEIRKLKTLIDNAVKKFGYKNMVIKQDSSLARNGTRYFTANSVNVENEVYDSEGFTIYYYAVKEYFVSSDGTERYFQTRSYIKVK